MSNFFFFLLPVQTASCRIHSNECICSIRFMCCFVGRPHNNQFQVFVWPFVKCTAYEAEKNIHKNNNKTPRKKPKYCLLRAQEHTQLSVCVFVVFHFVKCTHNRKNRVTVRTSTSNQNVLFNTPYTHVQQQQQQQQ